MRVGFVGLGNVGAKLAGSLLKQGHTLHIRDVDRAAAAALLAIEVAGDAIDRSSDIEAVASEGIQVHGPETGGGTTRWFIQGTSIQDSRVQLRGVVQRWRDSGLRVRVDADPIDL